MRKITVYKIMVELKAAKKENIRKFEHFKSFESVSRVAVVF